MSPTSSALPNSIEFALVDDDEFLRTFAVRHLWTPFEAACLVLGYKPGPIDGRGVARVGITTPYLLTQDLLDEFDPIDPANERHLINIAESIIQKWGPEPVPAQEIVEWALRKGEMRNTPFVRKVLGYEPEHEHLHEIDRLHAQIARLEDQLIKAGGGKGGHFEEKRSAILGLTIQELARFVPTGSIDRLVHGDHVNASALADHLDAFRKNVGVPTAETFGFSHRNLEDTLRRALAAADKVSTNKK